MQTFCHACQDIPLLTDVDFARQLCDSCATKLGIVVLPPATRPPAPCAKCGGRKFVRAIPREHATVQVGKSTGMVSAPMFVTHEPNVDRGWVFTYVNLDTKWGQGMLE